MFKKAWQKFYIIKQSTAIIYEVFANKRQQEINKAKRLYCARRIKRGLKKRMKRYGQDTETRIENTLRHTLTGVSTFLLEPDRSMCKNIVRAFLKKSADRNEKFDKFVNYYQQGDRIVQFYKRHYRAKKLRIEFLNDMWDRTIKDLVKNSALGKGKAKKMSKLVKKANTIDEDLKQKCIHLYYKYCEYRYRYRFLKYRMQANEEGGDNFGNENKLIQLETAFLEIDKVLFGHDTSVPKKTDDHKTNDKSKLGLSKSFRSKGARNDDVFDKASS